MDFVLDPMKIEDYRLFLKAKTLPQFRCRGRNIFVPDEYAAMLGVGIPEIATHNTAYAPIKGLFDYQQDIAAMAIRKKKFAIFADCVAGETVVNGPNGSERIDVLASKGEPIHVWALNNRGHAVHAMATAPFINGYAPLYRFSFSSGRSITATMGHRFLTNSGWKRGEDLLIGEQLAVSSLCHPQSNSESCLSMFLASDPRSCRTIPNCQDGYSAYRHRYGERLLHESDSDQSSTPLQVDVHGHTRKMWRKGVMESKSRYNHRRQFDDLPSKQGFLVPFVTTAATVEYRPLSSGPSYNHESIRTSRQAREGTILVRPIRESHPLAKKQNEFDHYQVYQPYNTPILDTLVTVDYIRDDVFYDLEVPGFENYLANGVWSHNCGTGKTLMLLEYAKHAAKTLAANKKTLIVSPLMVVKQTIQECQDWYGDDLKLDKIPASDLDHWLTHDDGSRIGITNYDGLHDDIQQGRLGALIPDESSTMKSHYGKWGQTLLRLGDGLEWKLALTGTPAPNDRIEFANHAVFLDAFPTINSFLAKYFVNKGQTQERWILKPHALGQFYRDLSHWCIFLTNPAVYGWKDNCGTIPPIRVHIHDVDLTNDQREAVIQLTGKLFLDDAGGITTRSKLARIGKGDHDGKQIETKKFKFIQSLVDSWPEESTIIWCWHNNEQDLLEKMFPNAASIQGLTPHDKRESLIDDFKAGRRKILLSKPRVLGYGLNLQIARRQIFSSLIDSYEAFYQAVKRSNRVGSTQPLDVHVPVTEIERPMVDNVLRKAARVQADSDEQERIFKTFKIAS